MELNSQLNFDSVIEILSRSSLKTVDTCRLLSKDYHRLTYESSFTNLHSQRTKTETGFFLHVHKYGKIYFVSANDDSNTNPSLDFVPYRSSTIAASSAQGLLVCIGRTETRRVPRYYVCKPVTKEWKRIPNPKTRYPTVAVGIKVLKSNPLHYKIVRFSEPTVQFVDCFHRCEIFDSMRGNWRQIEQVKLPYEGIPLSGGNPISACGKLHWSFGNKVFAFDVDDEKYSLFPLPFPSYDSKDQLTYYEGKLALISKKEGYFDLWVLEKYQEKQWSKRATVSTLRDKSEEGGEDLHCPFAFCNSDVALIPYYTKLLFFKFKNGKSIDEIEIGNINIKPEDVFPFRSDSEPCNLKNEISCKNSSKRRRRNKSRPRKDYLNDFIGRHFSFSLSPMFVFLLLLCFFTSVCYVLDI